MSKKSRKKIISGVDREIKKALKEKNLIIGTRVVFKGLKKGNIKKVIYASNCPAENMKDLEQYGKSGAEPEAFSGNSVKLGELCGKTFKTLMVGIKK